MSLRAQITSSKDQLPQENAHHTPLTRSSTQSPLAPGREPSFTASAIH